MLPGEGEKRKSDEEEGARVDNQPRGREGGSRTSQSLHDENSQRVCQRYEGRGGGRSLSSPIDLLGDSHETAEEEGT